MRPLTGNQMVVIAAEGVGKSVWALNWALEIKDHPVLYITLDTSMTDQAVRVIARHTGTSVDDVMKGHAGDVDTWADRWEPYLEQIHSRTRFFDRDVAPKVVEEVVAAEREYWGEPPILTIIDNVGNLIEKEESAAEYQGIFNSLHKAAKNQSTFVLALHHLRRKPAGTKRDRAQQDDPGIESVHASDTLYAGGRTSNFVLGLSRPEPNRLRINVLKSRMGRANPTGMVSTYLTFDGARARVGDVDSMEAYRRTLED